MSIVARVCPRCHAEKPLDEFPVKDMVKGSRRSYCRPCCREYGKEHYRRNKQYYLAKNHVSQAKERSNNRELIYGFLLDHACVDCGESDPIVLDFDHVDPTTKVASVGAMLSRRTSTAVRREMAKCVVRCANCHRRRTAVQFGYADPLASPRG